MSTNTSSYHKLAANATPPIIAQLAKMGEYANLPTGKLRELAFQQTPLYQKLAYLADVAEKRDQHPPLELIQAEYPFVRVNQRVQEVLALINATMYSEMLPQFAPDEVDRNIVPAPPMAFMRSPLGILISNAFVAPLSMPDDTYTAAQTQDILQCQITLLDDLHRRGRLQTWFPDGLRTYLRADVEREQVKRGITHDDD